MSNTLKFIIFIYFFALSLQLNVLARPPVVEKSYIKVTGYRNLVSISNFRCLRSLEKNKLELDYCLDVDYDSWSFEPRDSDNMKHTIVNRNGKALDVYGSNTAAGSQVGIWDMQISPNQLWIILKTPFTNIYALYNEASKKCLSASNTGFTIEECNMKDNRHLFKFGDNLKY